MPPFCDSAAAKLGILDLVHYVNSRGVEASHLYIYLLLRYSYSKFHFVNFCCKSTRNVTETNTAYECALRREVDRTSSSYILC